MFEGGDYGVGVTVTPLVAAPWPADLTPPGVTSHPARLGELLPVASRTDDELAAELQRVVRLESMLAAYKAELVTTFADRRPLTLDRSPDDPGAASPGWPPAPGQEAPAGVSEFFADELALVLNCSRAGATTLADHSMTLLNRLPATWAALADGELDWPRARGLAEELGWPARGTDPQIVAEVEAAVLPTAARLSVKGLRAAARRELLRRDAAAADRCRERAERLADVTVRPAGDGMAELTAFLPQPLAAACRETVDAYARLAKQDGDPRPIGQLRAGVLTDLILRPWDTSRPPVTAHLTVVAPLPALSDDAATGAETADVEGQPITIGHVRALLEQLDTLCPGGLQAPTGGTLRIALVDPVTGRLRATTGRPELERIARRGCATHGPSAECSCPVLDRPPPVDRYTPTPAQRRFVRTRDRTCRHPGCHGRAAWADLDHVVPHANDGPTDCSNLCCLCRRHHRLKTHAPGWRFAMSDDGVLTVTTPSGVTRITSPPWLDVDGLPAHLLPPSPPGSPVEDDPPPF
ncbi:HNH endonuclease signature motif containing protein [Modestobacter lapidis]|nr:DUF222 domain-containing protein [Modestobacter lapidis]